MIQSFFIIYPKDDKWRIINPFPHLCKPFFSGKTKEEAIEDFYAHTYWSHAHNVLHFMLTPSSDTHEYQTSDFVFLRSSPSSSSSAPIKTESTPVPL
jgi:hypothetical protein